MAISVNWVTGVITVPKADLTLIQSSPTEILQLNIMQFKEWLGDEYDNPDGRPWPIPFRHNEDEEVGGVTLADVFKLLPPYTVTFEDGQYAVNLVGANSNIGDRVNVNQVSVRSTNSAGLQNLETITSLAYGGGVYLDQINGQSGTAVPIGTQGTPVGNWQDAVQIANEQNTKIINIVGDGTLGAGDNVAGMIISGSNPLTSSLTVLAESVTNNIFVSDIFFSGALDGGTILSGCAVGDTDYFNGYFHNCDITDAIIKFNGPATIRDCRSGQGSDIYPTFDLTNATNVSMWGYHGQCKFINGASDIHVDITITGTVDIDSTCTAGNFHVHGDATVIHTQTGTEHVEDLTTATKEETAAAVWSHLTRELTVAAGLTPEQEAKLDQALIDIAGVPDAVMDEIA